MNLTTALELLKDAYYPFYADAYKICKKQGIDEAMPFYGEMYLNTYGDSEADIVEIVKFMKDHKLTSKKEVLEIFGGEAFESMLIQKAHPKNKYTSIDNSDYFKGPYKTVQYKKCDIFVNDAASMPIEEGIVRAGLANKFDLIFSGATNKSMCCLMNPSELRYTAEFVYRNLREDGYFVCTFVSDNFDQGITLDVEAISEGEKIMYNKQYKGLYKHWGMVTIKNPLDETHQYFTVAVITKKKKDNKPEDYVKFMHSRDVDKFKSWSAYHVTDIMKRCGFKVVNQYPNNVNAYFMVFQKSL